MSFWWFDDLSGINHMRISKRHWNLETSLGVIEFLPWGLHTVKGYDCVADIVIWGRMRLFRPECGRLGVL